MFFSRLRRKLACSTLLNKLGVPRALPRSARRGFTLVEIIVAMSIFLIVAFVAVSALLTVAASESRTSVARETLDNTAFALEDIVRNARTGKNYRCSDTLVYETDDSLKPFSCPGASASAFAFETINDGEYVAYRLNGDTLEKAFVRKTATNPTPSFSSSDFQPLTNERIIVDTFDVEVFGAEFGDKDQARAFIRLHVTANKGTENEEQIRLQSTATQRKNDL